jgi:hypothetical protein
LKNGSFLDRGAELAAQLLASGGRPGRVILMTDGELRSRFDQSATVTTLRHAPAGTVVHVVYPGFWSTKSNQVHHLVPDGLDKLSADLGGASYGVDVDVAAPSTSELSVMLKRLIAPDRIESLELRDPRSGETWPDPSEGPALEDEIVPGDGQIASGVSTKRPPERLTLVGWVWGKKVEVHFQQDRTFERMLPRIATSDVNVMECHSTHEHMRRALREGFLAPGLRFWVPGSGDTDEIGWGGYDDYCHEGAEGGGGTAARMPKLSDLSPYVGAALERCHLVRSATGTLQVNLETSGIEIVDVAAKGGVAEDRRCAEEACWGATLPDDFNQNRWGRTEYAFALSRGQHKDTSP